MIQISRCRTTETLSYRKLFLLTITLQIFLFTFQTEQPNNSSVISYIILKFIFSYSTAHHDHRWDFTAASSRIYSERGWVHWPLRKRLQRRKHRLRKKRRLRKRLLPKRRHRLGKKPQLRRKLPPKNGRIFSWALVTPDGACSIRRFFWSYVSGFIPTFLVSPHRLRSPVRLLLPSTFSASRFTGPPLDAKQHHLEWSSPQRSPAS